ncbi:MAG: TolC family protein [Vicinamibacterales bacterium]
MKALLCALLSVCLVLSGGVANAQSHLIGGQASGRSIALAEAARGVPLSLAAAIDESLRRNADLEVSRRQVEPLRVRPTQARALMPPRLEAQIWQWPVNTLNPSNTNMFMFMASQDLPGRGKRAASTALAEAEIRVAEANVKSRERDVIKAVTETYWDLFAARRAISTHIESVDFLNQMADMAQAKYAAGRAAQKDVLKTIVEATKVHEELVDLERAAKQASIHLNALLNRSSDSPVGAVAEPEETTLQGSLDDLQAIAAREQPDLRAVRLDVDRARAESVVAQSATAPDWSVGAGYMLQPRQTDAWLAQVSVSWPRAPWSRKGIEARGAEARAALSVTEAEAAARVVRVRTAISDAYSNVKAAEERAALLRTVLIPQSRQAVDVARIGYQTDRTDVLSLIDDERTLLQAQLMYARALVEWRRAVADLERAVGSSLAPAVFKVTLANEAAR